MKFSSKEAANFCKFVIHWPIISNNLPKPTMLFTILYQYQFYAEIRYLGKPIETAASVFEVWLYINMKLIHRGTKKLQHNHKSEYFKQKLVE